jgi:hypothetical protein
MEDNKKEPYGNKALKNMNTKERLGYYKSNVTKVADALEAQRFSILETDVEIFFKLFTIEFLYRWGIKDRESNL